MTAEADEKDVDDVDIEDEKDAEDDEAEYEPPSRERWETTTKRLERANKQAKHFRLKYNEERDRAAAAASKGDAKDDEAAEAEKVKRAEDRAVTVWKPRLVRTAAKAALVEAGLKGSPDKLLRLIDADDCDVDDEGEVTGLDSQVEDLREEYPELFGKKTPGRRGRGDVGDRGDGAGDSKLSASERQARSILRRP